ncbi:hypothetical protein V500_02650 [Pseudogymnoascus sp. VKM F-4518 (FW-2643)]|nr:hypothetical protein V500_02650 [Pseudogymnoascus sp. VKM F-4518 (FW-2643)]
MSIMSLASGQSFSYQNVERSAQNSLRWAAERFDEEDEIDSANQFLKIHRTVHGEIEKNLYTSKEFSPSEKQNAILEHNDRMLLSLISLHDFVQVCNSITSDYKDKDDKYKLNLHAPAEIYCGLTIASDVGIKENNKVTTLKQGSSLAHVLPVYDPLGRLLKEASSFKDAAITVSRICLFQVACVFNLSKKHEDGYNFISESMLWVSFSPSERQMAIESFRNQLKTPVPVERPSPPAERPSPWAPVEKPPLGTTARPVPGPSFGGSEAAIRK